MDSYESVELILKAMELRIILDGIEKLVNNLTHEGFSALHFAAYRGNIKIIELLISNGADIKEVSNRGLNMIHLSVQGDQSSSLVYFVEKLGLDLNSKDNMGSTALHWAVYLPSENVLNFILYRYSDLIDVNCQDSEGLTPLHLAVVTGSLILIM